MEVSMAGMKPFLAMPTNRDIPPKTVRSLLDTQALMQRAGLPVTVDMHEGSSLVHHARNRATHVFLKSDCTHLFWIDSDVVWSADDFLRFCALGQTRECVCGAYPRKADNNGPEFYLRYFDKKVQADEYGLIKVKGTGIGFTIVQRKVIEALASKAKKLKYSATGPEMAQVFRADDEEDGEARGEDYTFFADVRALGFDVLLDATITLGHIGPKQYRASVTECMG